jgi:hypothetical protein
MEEGAVGVVVAVARRSRTGQTLSALAPTSLVPIPLGSGRLSFGGGLANDEDHD